MVQTTFCSIQPPAGSGKTMSIQELYLRQTALQEQVPTAPIAQAINASYYGEVYYKNVSLLHNNNPQEADTGLNNLLIYPNPAANTAIIQLQQPTEKVWQLHIYNLQGVLQKTYTCNGSVLVLPIDLPNGMYICKAITGTQVLSIQKLLIAK
ncbi:MAG TPA: T9SS type A sorting domain-containing protein [Chitinophagales bacterium]|nr:T9SS type A sorting domain-containing protein [Chitinophagales bacterium]